MTDTILTFVLKISPQSDDGSPTALIIALPIVAVLVILILLTVGYLACLYRGRRRQMETMYGVSHGMPGNCKKVTTHNRRSRPSRYRQTEHFVHVSPHDHFQNFTKKGGKGKAQYPPPQKKKKNAEKQGGKGHQDLSVLFYFYKFKQAKRDTCTPKNVKKGKCNYLKQNKNDRGLGILCDSFMPRGFRRGWGICVTSQICATIKTLVLSIKLGHCFLPFSSWGLSSKELILLATMYIRERKLQTCYWLEDLRLSLINRNSL